MRWIFKKRILFILNPIILWTSIITLHGCGREQGTDSLPAGGVYQPVIAECMKCHSSTLNPLLTNGSGSNGKHIRHVSEIGLSCTRCHLNYKNNSNHMNGKLDTPDSSILIVFFDSVNPSGQWINDSGPKTGSCATTSCHGPDTLEWYGRAGWTLPDCYLCHSAPTATRRQIMGNNGDFSLNSSIESHHVTGVNDPASSQCLVCHDLSHHTAGTVILKNTDTNQSIIYTSPASLEPFCLSCHDSDGANGNMSPFNDGSTLGTEPYSAGVRIKENWYKTFGHRQAGLTCLGNGSPGTGCHGNYNATTESGSINAHGSGNAGLLSNKFTLPITTSLWDESRYRLCLDCHSNYTSIPTIAMLAGVAPGGNYAQPQVNYTQWPYYIDFMFTGFHDYYSYNMDRQYNLHLYHLIEGMGQWYYRGITDSIPSCTACHNVHGAGSQYYLLWDEWNFSIEYDSGTEYGKVNKDGVGGDFGCIWGYCDPSMPAWTPQYPEYCAANCHWDGHFRYPRYPFNEAKAVAHDTSGGGPGLQDGDTVTIYFSDSTNGAPVDEGNINNVLQLSGGHSWIDTDKGSLPPPPGMLIATWSSTDGKANNVLTITIYVANSPSGDPTVVPGDSIFFDLTTIRDLNGTPVRGKMTLMESF